MPSRISTLYVLVVAFCLGLPVISSLLKNHLFVRRFLGLILCALSVCGILALTIWGRPTHDARTANPELFWSYRESLALAEEGVSITNKGLLVEILNNIVLFVPLGACLAFLVPELLCTHKVLRDVLIVAVIAFDVSIVVEVVQWLQRLGLFEFDDVMNNTIGSVLGFVMYRTVAWICQKAVAAH